MSEAHTDNETHTAQQALPTHAWISAVKARGLAGALGVALDVLEPFGALSAQLVWVMQPTLSLVIPRVVLGDLATALETPEGIAHLRQQLE